MKIELHCHLDGSLNLYSVQEMLREQGEIYELEELKTQLEVLPECTSLTEYLEKFSLPLRCLQTKEGLRRAAYELVRDASKEGVRYIEVRFAPMLSTEGGLECEEVIASVVVLEEHKKNTECMHRQLYVPCDIILWRKTCKC